MAHKFIIDQYLHHHEVVDETVPLKQMAPKKPEERPKSSPDQEAESFVSETHQPYKFPNDHFGTHATTNWVRLHADDGELTQMIDNLSNHWQLATPRLIVEVAGSTEDILYFEQNLVKSCQSALIESVRRVGAWLVTSGQNRGIARVVGEAVAKRRLIGRHVTCLGVASWQDNLPTSCLKIDTGNDKFIFFENYAAELCFRNSLLLRLAANRPLIMIAAGGGFRTFKMIETALNHYSDQIRSMDEANVPKGSAARPVILLKGFGGVVDLLATAYELVTDKTEVRTNPNLWISEFLPPAVQKFPEDFEKTITQHPAFCTIDWGEENTENIVKRIKICLLNACHESSHLLSVAEVTSDSASPENFANALVKAMTNAGIYKFEQVFELCQLWNCTDRASQLLLRERLDSKYKITEVALPPPTPTFTSNSKDERRVRPEVGARQIDTRKYETRLTRAIELGQADFFEMILQYGALELRRYLTEERLKSFYGYVIRYESDSSEELKSPATFFRSLYQRFNNMELGEDIGQLELVGNVISQILTYNLSNPFREARRSPGRMIRDLFLLMLMMKRFALAKSIWRHGRCRLASSLMACIFLKKLAQLAKLSDMKDLVEHYQNEADNWRQICCSALDKCFTYQPDEMAKIFSRRCSVWQDRTFLEIAYYGDEKTVICHSSIQAKLAQVWYGRIAQYQSLAKIYFSLIPVFGLLTLFFTNFSPGTKQPKIQGKNLLKPQIFNICCRGKARIALWKALFFLYSAPISRLATHSLFLFAFLTLFTYFLLGVDLQNNSEIEVIEYILWFWSLSLVIDTIQKQISPTTDTLTWQQALHFMYEKTSTLLIYPDFLAAAFMLISVILRACSQPSITTYSVSCLFYWLKNLQIIQTSKMGLHVITFGGMLGDIKAFFAVYFVILLAFSLPIHALIYPHRRIANFGDFLKLWLSVLYSRWWNLAGVGLEESRLEVEGSAHQRQTSPGSSHAIWLDVKTYLPSFNGSMTVNETCLASSLCEKTAANLIDATAEEILEGAATQNYAAILAYCAYLAITNILLLNLLIALLSYRVDETRKATDELWHFGNYVKVMTFYNSSYTPPPFNLAEWVCGFVYRKITNLGCIPATANTSLKIQLPDEESKRIEEIENFAINA